MKSKLKTHFAALMQGHDIPADLLALLTLEDKANSIFKRGRPAINPLEFTETKLLLPGDTHPLISHDYINDRDRENVDIMCNVKAMDDTAKKFAFVAAQDRGVLGYWLGDSNPATSPSIFILDTEGQYAVAEGETLAETLCYDAIIYDDTRQYDLLWGSFKKLGIEVEHKEKEDVFAGMDARKKSTQLSPQWYRHERYNLYRQENGKEPIGFIP